MDDSQTIEVNLNISPNNSWSAQSPKTAHRTQFCSRAKSRQFSQPNRHRYLALIIKYRPKLSISSRNLPRFWRWTKFCPILSLRPSHERIGIRIRPYLGSTLITTVRTMISQWTGDETHLNIIQYVDGNPRQLTQSELYVIANA